MAAGPAMVDRKLNLNEALCAAQPEIRKALEFALDRRELGFDEGALLARADGHDLTALVAVADELRRQAGLDSYDTVFGVFDEGAAAYPGAGFKEKTHIQLTVRNPDVIIGYFRVETTAIVTP